MSANATDTNGKYVTHVEVNNGTIKITYGYDANTKIANGTLAITPYETPDASVAWQCGNSADPQRRRRRPLGNGTAAHRWHHDHREVPAEGLPSVIARDVWLDVSEAPLRRGFFFLAVSSDL